MKRRSHSAALRLGVSVLLCCTSLILWGSARILAQRSSNVYADTIISTPDIPQSAQAPTDAAFLLRSHQGVVCVYQGTLLLYETDIPVDSLPESDRKLLSSGINVRNELELQRFLEDFGA